MTETDAHRVMTEIRALWPKMPITDFILARYIKQLTRIHLAPKDAIAAIHDHYDRQRGDSKIPRIDPPMKILIGQLHSRSRQDASESPEGYEVEVGVDHEPLGWSDEAQRVLSKDEWADSHARLGDEMERKYPKQPELARIVRERGERIREHGLEGAGRPPVEKIVGAMR